MDTSSQIVSVALAFALALGSGVARAQGRPLPVAPPEESGATPPGAPPASSSSDEKAPSEATATDAAKAPADAVKGESAAPVPEEHDHDDVGRPDQVRFRGGFRFEGAGVIVPSSSLSGGAASPILPALHLGVQINHLFGLAYENHPFLMFTSGGGGVSVGFADLNVFVASLTFVDTIELGAGGGFDFFALAGCNGGTGCGAGTVVTPAVHGKLAAHLGGWSGKTPARSGFSIEGAFHAAFDPSGGVILMPIGGIGGEWF